MKTKKLVQAQAIIATLAFLFVAGQPLVRAESMATSGMADMTTTAAASASMASAAVMPSNLSSTRLSGGEFGTLFRPLALNSKYTGFMEKPFNLPAAGIDGMYRTEVFQGIPGGRADGLYAYAFQASSLMNNKKQINDLEGVRHDFNSSLVNTSGFTNQSTHALEISTNDGVLGKFKAPTMTSGKLDAPAALNFRILQDADGQLTQGSLTANFNDGLTPGQSSSIFAVVSKDAPERLATVNIRGGEFVDSGMKPVAWQPDSEGRIVVPVPEPASVLAWAGLMGAGLVFARARRRSA